MPQIFLPFSYLTSSCTDVIKIGIFRNHDGNDNENVTRQLKYALLVLLRDYSNLVKLNKVAELSSNRTGLNGDQVLIKCYCFTMFSLASISAIAS